MAPRPRRMRTCSTLQTMGVISNLLSLVYTVWRPPTKCFKKSSKAWGKHSMVLPLIIKAAIFSPRYSTILHSLAVGSLVGTVGGGESLPKLRSMNLCMKSKSVEPGVRPGWPPAKPGCRKGGGWPSIEAMDAMDIAAVEGTKVGGLFRGDMAPGRPWKGCGCKLFGWGPTGLRSPRGLGGVDVDLKSLGGGEAGEELFRLFSILLVLSCSIAKHIAQQLQTLRLFSPLCIYTYIFTIILSSTWNFSDWVAQLLDSEWETHCCSSSPPQYLRGS